ncbi:hypothetical protein [Ferrimicrobium sp.]|uniref:hypothetical protein n=1 Tax=Ferrimicrobium sp. TaxID=2926050 RepID=UPI00260B481F|nr:hypothetical protein [Ferrimicrobium sp.]
MIAEISSRLLLPSLDEMESVLSNLMNAGVRADRYPQRSLLPTFYLAGLYHDQDDVLRSIIAVDFSFALTFGAGLSMIPKGMIDEARAAGTLTDTMMANVHEILNIFGLLFNEQRPHAPRARLTQLVEVSALAAEAMAFLGHPHLQGIDATISWRDRRPVGVISIRLLSKLLTETPP